MKSPGLNVFPRTPSLSTPAQTLCMTQTHIDEVSVSHIVLPTTSHWVHDPMTPARGPLRTAICSGTPPHTLPSSAFGVVCWHHKFAGWLE